MGGASAGIRNLISASGDDLRHEVVCFDDPYAYADQLDECPVHKLGKATAIWGYKRGFKSWLAERADAYDIWIVHGLWLWHGQAARATVNRLRSLAGSAEPALFIWPHGMLDPWFQRAKGRRMKAIRNHVYWALLEKHVIRDADGILFTSPEEMRLARSTFPGYRHRQAFEIGLGTVSPPPFSGRMRESLRAVNGLLCDAAFMLFLGRIDPKKGIDLILDGYATILRSGQAEVGLPNLLIAGPGWDTPYGRSLRKRIDGDSILRRHVLISGMLQGESKWGALHLCDAFILPSHQENFGVAVAEALSCGRPVLLSDKVNIHPWILEAGAGLVETDDSHGVFRLLQAWRSLSAEEKSDMSQAASMLFRDRLHISHCVKKFKEAITIVK